MEQVPHSQIAVLGVRQRKFFDEMKIVDLAEDIQRTGLLHAVVLQDTTDTLVAGERRLRAIEHIYRTGGTFKYNGQPVEEGYVPVTRVDAKTEIELFEAELSENLAREDLSWQERSAAVAQLHELRMMQTGGGQTITDTAREIKGEDAAGGMVTDVREDIVLSQFMGDGDVRKAKSKTEAVKIVKKKLQEKKNEELAEAYKQSETLESPHEIIHGEAIEELQKLPDNSIDVILTDPPYGIGADTFGDQTFINHEYDDSFETWMPLMVQLATETFRVAKQEAHAYIFCDPRRFDDLKTYFESEGWYVWPQAFIWDKGNIGTLPRPEHGPRRCYESILYAIKGDRKVNGVYHDVIRIAATAKPRHAAEKPVELYTELLKRSVKPGDSVLDCFAGSGTIFPAANRTLCKAKGIELIEANVGICASRLEEE